MSNRDTLRTTISDLVQLGHDLDNALGETILVAARTLRSSTLHGSFPDKSVLGGLSNLLKACGIDFALIGGIAVSIHGLERSTDDIDCFVSALPEADKLRDSEFMGKFGFYKAQPSRTGTMLTLDHKAGQCELLLANNPLRKWALATAKQEQVLGHMAPVISPEALVASKVQSLHGNPARAKKDDPDIRGVILEKGNDFDFAVVDKHLSPGERETFESLIPLQFVDLDPLD